MAENSPQVAPVNQWQLNQIAKRWLRQAREPAEPMSPFLFQLAKWGLEQGAAVRAPAAPNHPTRADLEHLIDLLLEPGAKAAMRATEWLLSNPNMSRPEQATHLASQLEAAKNPQESAQIVLEATFDRMVAES